MANSISFITDSGRMLENVVFGQLRRRFNDIFYFKGKGECDFLVSIERKIKQAIQVCYELTDDNKEREINGLLEALDTFNLITGLILTFNQDDSLIVGDKSILVKPTWRWMID